MFWTKILGLPVLLIRTGLGHAFWIETCQSLTLEESRKAAAWLV
jgi:hypothetical protein